MGHFCNQSVIGVVGLHIREIVNLISINNVLLYTNSFMYTNIFSQLLRSCCD